MNETHKDEDIAPLSPEEIKAIGSIGIGPSKQDIFLNRHYRKLIWGGIGIAIIAGAAIAYASNRNDMRAEAASRVVVAMKGSAVGKVASPEDYDAKVLEAIRAEHASTPSAATAKLLEGRSLLAGSDEQAAAGTAILQEIIDSAEASPLLRACAHTAIATRAMLKDDEVTATAHWTALTMMGETPYTALAYLSLGDMAKAAGKVDDARKYYTQGMTTCVGSPFTAPGGVIAARLELLDVDDPRQVAPGQAAASPLDEPQAGNPFGEAPAPAPAPADGGSVADDLFGNTSTLPPTQVPTLPLPQ